jgi:putative oxygen-independent coproporphyrinogen III oxidase
LKDFITTLPDIQHREIYSIFMGGGTPSLFSPESIERLLRALQNLIAFKNNIEITLEANPGTVEQSRFRGFHEAGINRLSVGVQSFDKEKLKQLGRIHDDEMAVRAIEALKKAGFDNFNIDLMHGLPHQTVEDALSDIQRAIALSPPHLSWYQLTLEPNTPFYHQPPPLPSEKKLADIEEKGLALIKQSYQHYEVSAYCKENFHCRHNLNYWEFGDYVGIGAGAHGKITEINSQKIYRTTKKKHPKDYLSAEDFLTEKKAIPSQTLPFEFMLNALRLQKAIPWQLFEERTFCDRKMLMCIFEQLRHKKLAEFNESSFTLTPLGHQFLNDVLQGFMGC